MLEGRMNFTIDWFLKNTRDMLSTKTIPGYNGGGTFWTNQGELKNTGWEFSVSLFPLKNTDLVWETQFNATWIKNEVIDLAGDPYRIFGDDSGGQSSILMPGYPVGSFYLYQWKEFDEEGANHYLNANNILTTNPTGDDKVVKGQAEPAWSMGWNNMFTWKNWDVNIFINAVTGCNRLNTARFMLAGMAYESRFLTLSDAYYQSWDNVSNKANAKYPSLTNSDNKGYGDSDFWLENASFLKIRNVSIAYHIPRQLVKFADIRLFVSAQNLWTLTKYTGMDPESYNNNSGNDLGAYPSCRTFSFGVKLNF
jgi:hypothetical protein